MKDRSSYVVKPKTPVAMVVGVVAGCLLLLAGLFWSINYMQRDIADRKLTGRITEKEFIKQPSEEITIGKVGLQRQDLAGTFILNVRVPQKDGTERDFKVWVPEEIYNSVQVGDSFDVGPYLIPDGR